MRIASLLPGATESLFALGLRDSVVAVSHACDFPPEARLKPAVTRPRVRVAATSASIQEDVTSLLAQGESINELDDRLLVELAPDVILTQAQCDVCAISPSQIYELVRHPTLRDAIVVTLSALTLDEVLREILLIGRMTGSESRADSLVRGLRRRMDLVSTKSRDSASRGRPRVACLDWLDPPMIAGNWVPELIELAGGVDGIMMPGRHSEWTSWERIVEYDPEYIVLAPCGFDLCQTTEDLERLGAWPWAGTAAARMGRVYAVDGNAYFNRPGPRLVDSLEMLAQILHPEDGDFSFDVSQQSWVHLASDGPQRGRADSSPSVSERGPG
jgi:iron complex transport system substrate-binding protein